MFMVLNYTILMKSFSSFIASVALNIFFQKKICQILFLVTNNWKVRICSNLLKNTNQMAMNQCHCWV